MWDSFFGFLASLNPSSLHHPSPSVSTSPALLPIHPPPHIDLGRRHPPFIQSKPPTTPTSTHIIKLKRERQSIQPPLLPYHHHHRKRTDTITHHNERLRPKATGHEHPVYASSLFKHSNFASFVRQLNKCDFHKVKNTDDVQFALENIKRKVSAARKSPTSAGGGEDTSSDEDD